MNKKLWMLTAILTCGLVLASCSSVNTNPENIVIGARAFSEAFDAVVAAVNDGTISEERINQSVRRILTLRAGMNR